ncbi:MAG: ORF6N domain-containing protein [Patescibacteria group bacterium]
MSQEIVPNERIMNKIFLIRGLKIMFDFDLAELYRVEVKNLKRQVKRNLKRFPQDFMFESNQKELEIWRRHFVTSNPGYKMGLRYTPFVFTEQGVAMLSSVLKSDRAIFVNIQIMRTFTKLREIVLSHKELREKLEKMESKYDQNFKVVFDAIKRLLDKDTKPVAEIGFKDRK